MLSNAEKLDIVNQHIRTVEYLVYNAELDKIEAEASVSTSQTALDLIDEKLDDANAKIAALEAEKAKLS